MKILFTSDTHYGLTGSRTRKVHERFCSDLNRVIEENEVSLIVHAGDWITHRQEQLEKTFELFRRHTSVPILTVFGNHDYWEERRRNAYKLIVRLDEMDRAHRELLNQFGIHYLQDQPFEMSNTLFVGYDGWYQVDKKIANLSREHSFLPYVVDHTDTHAAFKLRESEGLQAAELAARSKPDSTVVCVTHFPPLVVKGEENHCADPAILSRITSFADFLLMGHFHQDIDTNVDGCRILTCGSEYNAPRYKILSL